MKIIHSNLIHKALLLCGVCLLLVGCATPQYLMPGGYSSTYQKALTQESMLIQEAAPLDPAVFQHAGTETAILR